MLLYPLLFFIFFFFNAPAPPVIYTLSLHDALPISGPRAGPADRERYLVGVQGATRQVEAASERTVAVDRQTTPRSEEHTSELQSHSDLVCRLLLEKKKKNKNKKKVDHKIRHITTSR